MVTQFESIIDQQISVRILTTFLKTGSIPHALLFTGIEGVGKKTAALAFAMACNCTAAPSLAKPQHPDAPTTAISSANPCGDCKSCRKIKAGHHPDVVHIKPSGAYIRIDQIRNLYQMFVMKPYEAKYRVAILADAYKMNPQAGNAFLKMLEEPPAQTVLILTAPEKTALLPTIVSRCQHVYFNPISRKNLAGMLTAQKGVDKKEAGIIASMAAGSFTAASAMIRPTHQVDWTKRRNWLVQELISLPSRPLGLILALAENLSRNKQILSEDLEVIKSWLRDLIVWQYNPKKIINKDLTDKVQYVSPSVPVPLLLKQIEAVGNVQDKIRANANIRLALEIMIFKLAKLLP